ncbi:MAG: DUF3341 domain-containing protein [Acidobacteria bacterium]|nr:DUF3341 domain-containing protein [Acidobacteriota bacterium]MDW7983140.1 DUF3341 domain-containing protein [Acidobacteriota bacterium]
MTGVRGVFTEAAAVVQAVRDLRRAGFQDITVFLPVPDPAVLAVLDGRPSPVRLWTLVGALLGGLSGFVLTIGTSLQWPIPTGAKPIVSIPPFIIIAFELTILLGALGTLVGFLVHSRLPRRAVSTTYDPRVAEDCFGVFVQCPVSGQPVVQAILQNAGVEEVQLEAP